VSVKELHPLISTCDGRARYDLKIHLDSIDIPYILDLKANYKINVSDQFSKPEEIDSPMMYTGLFYIPLARVDDNLGQILHVYYVQNSRLKELVFYSSTRIFKALNNTVLKEWMNQLFYCLDKTGLCDPDLKSVKRIEIDVLFESWSFYERGSDRCLNRKTRSWICDVSLRYALV